MKSQKCPICGAGPLQKIIKMETFNYKGSSKDIPNYMTWSCPSCGEEIVAKESLKESGKVLKDFQREVDGLLTGPQIKSIRMKLGLTQAQLAHIVGGGLKSVARYESGQVCQSKGMDNLLRILDAYPQTLNIINKNYVRTISKLRVVPLEEYKMKIVGYKGKNADFISDDEGVVADGV